MPYINLIQEQRTSTQAREQKARTFFIAFVAVSVASAGAFLFFWTQSMFIGAQISNLEAQAKKNAPLEGQIAESEQSLSVLKPRLTTLQSAQEITDRWNHIMDHLAVQTPPQAWLTGLRCLVTDASKPIQVSFVGVAPNQSPVGEFILRLQNLTDLENVTLNHTSEKLITDTKGIEFQVDADMVGSAEKKVKSEEEKK